jgi:hypothetical protein
MPWANKAWEKSLSDLEPQGYVIVAFDHPKVNYLDCARTLATTLRHWVPAARICLITDRPQSNDPIYDHYREISRTDVNNAWADDWQVFFQTPFRETIKLEADMMITSPIDHWWTMFRHRDVVVSTGCRNWRDEASDNRQYRRVFDANGLPDVYNAITYWRRSETARNFFVQVRDIFANWDQWRRTIRYAEDVPSTDLVYAMAAAIIGPELVTMPFASYPQIVHMKPAHAGTQTSNWTQELVWEYQDYQLRIQTVAQWGAVHYNVKDWRA